MRNNCYYPYRPVINVTMLQWYMRNNCCYPYRLVIIGLPTHAIHIGSCPKGQLHRTRSNLPRNVLHTRNANEQ